MIDFKRVPSSVFRLTYVREDVPVAVTVLGRAIGYYIPVGAPEAEILRAASRPGQEIDGSGPADPGRTEAPDDATAPAPSSPSGASRAPRTRAASAAGGSTAGMTQAERDRVLARVRKA